MPDSSAVAVESLSRDDYALAAKWMSNQDINQWLASGWRGKSFEGKVFAVLCMSPKNRLFLVRHEGKPCGLVSLGCIDRTDGSAVMWYVLGDSSLGSRGITTAAVRQVAQIAFTELGLQSISASTMAPNKPSERVLENAGFKRVGVLRNGFSFHGAPVDRTVFDLIPGDL